MVAYESSDSTIKFLNFESRSIVIFHLRSYNWVFSTQHIAPPKTKHLEVSIKEFSCELFFNVLLNVSRYQPEIPFRELRKHRLWFEGNAIFLLLEVCSTDFDIPSIRAFSHHAIRHILYILLVVNSALFHIPEA